MTFTSTPSFQPFPGYVFCLSAEVNGSAIWGVGFRAEQGRVRIAEFSSAEEAHEWAEHYRSNPQHQAELEHHWEAHAARAFA